MFKIKNQIIFCVIFIINVQLTNANALVEDEWLRDKVCTEGFKIIEVHRSKKEYELSHIPCSVFTNFYSSGWRETRNKIPLLMPSINKLEKLLGSLGILNSDHVIIVAPGTGKYDAAETAAIYFTFKISQNFLQVVFSPISFSLVIFYLLFHLLLPLMPLFLHRSAPFPPLPSSLVHSLNTP